MSVYAISDMHGNLPDIPADCSLLLIGGDICPDFLRTTYGSSVRVHRGETQQRDWLHETLRPWLEALRERNVNVVAIWGNHDFVGEKPHLLRDLALPWTLIQDEEIDVRVPFGPHMRGFRSLRIYGTPWVPKLQSWAFYASDEALAARAAAIPDGLDILLSHGPPYGVLDRCPESVGDVALYSRLLEMDAPPKHIVFGHIHEGHGQVEARGATFTNACVVDAFYDHVYEPTLLKL